MSKRRKDLGSSEDSFSEDFSPDKASSKKSSKKKSKTFKSSGDEISDSRMESKPRRRVAKESAFEKQLRLAMEQSLREAQNQQVDTAPKEISQELNSPVKESDISPKVVLDKVSSEELPNLDCNAKERETVVLKNIAEKNEAVCQPKPEDSKIPDNNNDIIELVSPKETIKNSAEKPKKSKKTTKLLDSSDEDALGDFVSFKETAKKSVEKPKKPNKSKVLNSSEDEDSFKDDKGQESSDEDYESKKKGSAKKKTPPKKKKESTKEPSKKKKSILNLNSPLELNEVQQNQTISPINSTKDSTKKKRSILDLKSPLEILEPNANQTVTPVKANPSGEASDRTKEPIETHISPDKENLKPKEAAGSSKKLVTMSDKYHEFNNHTLEKIEAPKTGIHGLLPKYVSNLPPSLSANTSSKITGNVETKQPANPTFKPMAPKLNQLANAASGKIEIKNHSPAVRVGLSRNHKFPSLHKNVKPLL